MTEPSSDLSSPSLAHVVFTPSTNQTSPSLIRAISCPLASSLATLSSDLATVDPRGWSTIRVWDLGCCKRPWGSFACCPCYARSDSRVACRGYCRHFCLIVCYTTHAKTPQTCYSRLHLQAWYKCDIIAVSDCCRLQTVQNWRNQTGTVCWVVRAVSVWCNRMIQVCWEQTVAVCKNRM